MSDPVELSPEVAVALAAGEPVVALESAILAHGLPAPENLRVGRAAEAAVRSGGAVPATVAVLGGTVRVGLDDAGLRRLCESDGVAKLGVRDLPVAVALGRDGATTVASTAAVAARCGIGVFATGGLGGVHRGAERSWDESADLYVLATAPVAVVCSGVKSVLDVAATLERLESLSVTVVGYGTDRFPGFYVTDSGHPVGWRVDSPEQAAAVLAARDRLGLGARAVVFANPLPAAEQLDVSLHDEVLASALAGLAGEGVTGTAVTPYLLDQFHRRTGGASLAANVALVLRNAMLAARIAAAYAAATGR